MYLFLLEVQVLRKNKIICDDADPAFIVRNDKSIVIGIGIVNDISAKRSVRISLTRQSGNRRGRLRWRIQSGNSESAFEQQ